MVDMFYEFEFKKIKSLMSIRFRIQQTLYNHHIAYRIVPASLKLLSHFFYWYCIIRLAKIGPREMTSPCQLFDCKTYCQTSHD